MTPDTSFVVFMQIVGLIMMLVSTIFGIFFPSPGFKQKAWLVILAALGFAANITGLVVDKIGADSDQKDLISRAESTLRKVDTTIQKSEYTIHLLGDVRNDAEHISKSVDTVADIQDALKQTTIDLMVFNIEINKQSQKKNEEELISAVHEISSNMFYVHSMTNRPLLDSSRHSLVI